MKNWHWVTIIVGVLVLGLAAWLVFFRSSDGPWVSSAPSKSTDVVRIASFNVEGLFDPEDDPRLSGANDDIPSSQAHLDAIAEAIRAIDADILALQDVESLSALEWFNTTYLSSLGYTHIASLDVGHDRGVENAVLSRFPVTDARVWPKLRLGGTHPATAGDAPNPMAGKPILFKRSPLMVEIDLPGKSSLTLFNIEHKGGNKYGYWRTAEAAAVARLCQAVGMNRRIIVLGSFHCEPGDPSLQPYFDLGFIDPLADDDNAELYATEITGDRTDFILANRVVGGDLESARAFILAGDLAERIRAGDAETTHLPVVIGLRLGAE